MSSSWSSLTALLNRGLSPRSRIEMKVRWPLFVLPIALFNQIFAPHPVWLVLLIVMVGIYTVGYLWVRGQAWGVNVHRTRVGALLVAGDSLREDFTLQNNSRLPVLWAELTDESGLPGYDANTVVACGAAGLFRWHTQVQCGQRGVYRLGPHHLTLGDPFGLYRLRIGYDHVDTVLIYPRVVHLPMLQLPHGNASGSDRRRRPLRGTLPAPFVDEYRPGDSLRYIHWPTTAHRGRLMVKELEIEPSGDVWIVLDLNAATHSGEGASSTLEYAVMLAASLAAELLGGSERRAVGLMTVSASDSTTATQPTAAGDAPTYGGNGHPLIATASTGQFTDRAVVLPPFAGQAQLWAVLAALAPVRASDVSLRSLLRSGREVLGRRRTLVLITAQGMAAARTQAAAQAAAQVASQDDDWLAELVHLRSLGLDSSVMLVAPVQSDSVDDHAASSDWTAPMRSLLAQQEIPAQVFRTGTPLRTALTFRRKRTVMRTTPTGGVVTYEIDEEVG